MTFDVMLFKQAGDGYIARPLLWPDAEVRGKTEQETLEAVRQLISSLLSRTRFVRVDVDAPDNYTGNPWIDKAGMFANDPTWNDFLSAMADHRRQVDSEQTSESV